MELCKVSYHGQTVPLRCSYHAAQRLSERKINVQSLCRAIARVIVNSNPGVSRIAVRDYSQHCTAILGIESNHLVLITAIGCANRSIKDAILLN